ncbi:Thiopurine S-methyltransferase [Roseovarius albus]|uniref:Thiopurine S-methyltransferase n=1 Tax=Roseovarius albus TaxID=1247867 RepID=A0A1X6Z689_9RHOB|nr:thiopurine S-methyltransferase [Roseovarius albus]SLN41500.1 Thiopurine S-methyltransferase [Roseovarius albus]
MDPNFWLERWENNHLGWHQDQAHPMLVKYLPQVVEDSGARIFLPLCGKTLDIGWLRTQGYNVVGAELSEIAVKQLFENAGVTPEITEHGSLKSYSARQINVFVGDIFDVTIDLLSSVDVVFDRAALVALPEDMRNRYAQHLAEITQMAPQLLISFEYDQNVMAGPPFSVPQAEITRLYEQNYEMSLLTDEDVAGGLKGICPAREQAWKLTKR